MKKSVMIPALLAGVAVMVQCCAAEASSIYTKKRSVAITSEVDRALEADWQKKGLLPVYEASDNLLVRRLYLDLTGRLPSIEEAKSFVYSRDPQKYEKLVDSLLTAGIHASGEKCAQWDIGNQTFFHSFFHQTAQFLCRSSKRHSGVFYGIIQLPVTADGNVCTV